MLPFVALLKQIESSAGKRTVMAVRQLLSVLRNGIFQYELDNVAPRGSLLLVLSPGTCFQPIDSSGNGYGVAAVRTAERNQQTCQ